MRITAQPPTKLATDAAQAGQTSTWLVSSSIYTLRYFLVVKICALHQTCKQTSIAGSNCFGMLFCMVRGAADLLPFQSC